MKHFSIAVALAFGFALIAAGCSSSNSGSGACVGPCPNLQGTDGGGGGGSEAGPPDPTPKESCVRPGDKGNDIGVGEYCSPLGKQCEGFDHSPACLADLGQTQWFCTRVGCTDDSQCGTGAYCQHDPAGSACVLNRCQPKDAGGSSSPTDAAAHD